MSETLVTKRDGRTELLTPEKYTQVCEWACEGIKGVSSSELALKSFHQMYNGISTKDLHENIIKTAVSMIDEHTPNYDKVAARLVIYQIRKEVYGEYEPLSIYELVKKNVKLGVYTPELLDMYTEDEYRILEGFIKHNRDEDFTFAATEQLRSKYLVQDRSIGKLYESPQVTYLLVAAVLFHNEAKDVRMEYIKDYYNEQSTHMFSIPSPIAAGVRTPIKQFSSCVLIPAGDSLNSICAAGESVVKYAAQRAGIGLDVGRIRAVGSKVKDGSIKHTGVLPFVKKLKGDLKSCSQGGMRGGAATVYYPWWHYEFPELIVLKNNSGTEESRERHVDYGVQFNGLIFERFLAKQDVTLFSPHEVPELQDLFYRGGDFKTAYEAAEKNPMIRKRVISAKELINSFCLERSKTGRIYPLFMDNILNQGSFVNLGEGQQLSSNLCVAPETQILTKDGYVPIAELEDCTFDTWNGEEWSEVTVSKTGVDQSLLKVTTSSGQDIECTPYHKFYVFNGYGKPYVEKRACELVEGDKLAKFDLPLITGGKELKRAYINGFYTGDGCLEKGGRQKVYFYHEKRELTHLFKCGSKIYRDVKQKRDVIYYNNLKDKFFVPSSGYSVKSRLDWLAGWLDADGCIYRNGTNEAITGSSVEYEFLKEVQLMLQTLGVSAKLNEFSDEGYKPLPANDGTGELKDFWCRQAWRLIITSVDSHKLLNLGLTFHRLKIKKRLPQRDAKQFNKVVSVIDEGRTDDTFCFNEPKRHMGMFNGILTGQCLEITLPIKQFTSTSDLEGMIALCTLSSSNWGKLKTKEDLEKSCRSMVRALDNLLSYQDYPVLGAETFTKAYRALGIGIVGFAHWLAKRGLKYDINSVELVDEYMEAMAYYLTDESVRIAQEKGPCESYKDTCYGQGVFPWERRHKNVDKIVKHTLRYDWEELRERMIKYGIRNATLMAIAPTESSSTLLGETNGIEPPLMGIVEKVSKDGKLKQVVPEYHHLKNKYHYKWDHVDNKGYLLIMAVLQKWVDQSISSNTDYDPSKMKDSKVPLSLMVQDLLFAYNSGMKTLYYHNTNDMNGEPEEDNGCDSGACVI